MEKEIIINLNGKKITAPTKPSESTAVFKVKNGRTLIINGDGVVDGGYGSFDNNAISIEGGHVIINGGMFKVGRDIKGLANTCIYIRKPGGILEINGGDFLCCKSSLKKNEHDWYPIINVTNSLRQSKFSVKITGGTFYGYDPKEGDDSRKKSFLADGYDSVIDGEYMDNEGNTMPIYKIIKKQN